MKMPYRILIIQIVLAEKMKLNKIALMISKVRPPNMRIPEEVAQPTGKVVWLAKSVSVERRGQALSPINAAHIYENTRTLSYNEIHSRIEAPRYPRPNIKAFFV